MCHLQSTGYMLFAILESAADKAKPCVLIDIYKV